MGATDGTIIGTTQVLNHGPRNKRWNLVFISEGFIESELPQFAQDISDFRARLIETEPFKELERAINIFRIDVASDQSGADDPVDCAGGQGTVTKTFFDAKHCSFGGIRRALTVSKLLVRLVVDDQVPEAHAVVVLVNSEIEGGTGGRFAIASKFGDWIATVIHELGHTPFGLADEYEYWVGCGEETDRDIHPNNEPSEPNVTIRSDGKWSNLRTTGILPTTTNEDKTLCDPQPNPFAEGVVGAFEGAHYYHSGAYRPEFNCMMRNNNEKFCAVCRCRIWKTLAKHMPEQFLGNSNTREVHRIRSRNANCQLCEIKPSHRQHISSLTQAHGLGYDNCHWCIGGSKR